MIERAAVRFNPGDYYEMAVDKDAVTCDVHGYMNGEPIDFSGGGGVTNVVLGDFTPSVAGTEILEIPYEGEGFPIALMIWIDDISQPHEPSSRVLVAISKRTSEPPTYNSNSDNNNKALIALLFKRSSDVYDYNGSNNSPIYDAINEPGSYQLGFMKIADNKTIKYWTITGGSSYGFYKDTKYNYMIKYSE